MRVGGVDVTVSRIYGVGTFGSCIAAEVCPGVTIAIKRFHRRNKSVFQRECNIMRSIAPHPHIVRWYGSVVDGAAHFEHMEPWMTPFQLTSSKKKETACFCLYEAVDGGDLFQALSSLRDHPEYQTEEHAILVLKWWLDIGTALQHIHSQGWVHTDLKPENVLLRRSGMAAIIADLGSAVAVGSHFNPQHHGTPTYSPPECNIPTKDLIAHVSIDLFSWGRLLALLLHIFKSHVTFAPQWRSWSTALQSPQPQDRPSIDSIQNDPMCLALQSRAPITIPPIFLLGNTPVQC